MSDSESINLIVWGLKRRSGVEQLEESRTEVYVLCGGNWLTKRPNKINAFSEIRYPPHLSPQLFTFSVVEISGIT
jgi:hypothetical protein